MAKRSQAGSPKHVKVRDYKAEYARRIARGKARGLTNAQARGHAKAGEKRTAKSRSTRIPDDRFQIALHELGQGKPLSAVAKSIGVSTERLRRELRETKAGTKKGGRWTVSRKKPRRMLLYSNGKALAVTVKTFKAASEIGTYMNAVKMFAREGDADLLREFVGQSITDATGKPHPFETRPNVLYRLLQSGSEPIEQIYRIVV